ncbi:MAG: hypothetical protein WC726_03310 [Parcubacteria group bacterium]|jgi:hypothetical protein
MWQKYSYKLTKDLLISLVITYFLLIIPELILPGIVSSHFDPKYLLAIIFIIGFFFAEFGKSFKTTEKSKFQAISRNLLNIILFTIAMMLVLSLYKMQIWQIAVVVVISIPLLIGAENILIKEK